MKIATILSLITLLVLIIAIGSDFEESYCWEKGMQADITGSKMITATKEDARELKGFGVNPGSQVGVSFRAHMLCHYSFNFPDAVISYIRL